MLAVVAICLSGVSMVINIIATAIPYWLYGHGERSTVNVGLWKRCDTVCQDFSSVPDWFKATRSFEILGIIFIVAALACGILKLIQKSRIPLLRAGAAFSFLSGALMLAGAIIFAIRWEDIAPNIFKLHAGFGLCIAAGVLAKIAGWLYLITARQESVQPSMAINKY